ncbi:MAG: hypothetical protein QM677_03355 [Microbacterium sp.]
MASPGVSSTAQEDVSEITDQPGSVEGYVGALGDAEVVTCAREGGDWVVAGTVTNPLDEVQSYRIYVTVRDDDDTRGIIQVDVPDVEGEASAEWTASFPLDDESLECVLRVERFTP